MDGIREKTKAFVKSVEGVFGSRLVSIAAYGSAADGRYVKGVSDINILVIAGGLTMKDISELKKTAVKYAVKNGLRPFFFSPDFIKSSSDVFPLEWKEIREHHIILYGNDAELKNVAINKNDLRLQLERELKQNYTAFRQGLLFNREISSLLEDSYSFLKVFLRNMKESFGREVEQPAYLEKMESLFRYPKIKIARAVLEDLAEKHLDYLDKLVRIADKPVMHP